MLWPVTVVSALYNCPASSPNAAHTRTHRLSQEYKNAQTNKHSEGNKYLNPEPRRAPRHTHTHTHTYYKIHTRTCTHTHTHTLNPRTHKPTHTRTHGHTHTHPHARTHAHAHTHTRTCTRTRGSNFDTMSRETTSHPAASKALPIDFVPQNSSSSLGMFNNYHQRNKARTAQAVSHARTNLFLIGDRKG